MKRLGASLLVIVILTLCPAEANPHHSNAPVYDSARVITVVGVVTEFRFVNPHAMVYLDVADETGKVVKWTVEAGGSLQLAETGWTAKSLMPGDRITVTGNPTHTGSPKVWFLRLVRQDGTELLSLGEQRRRAVEEERRQRALKRSK